MYRFALLGLLVGCAHAQVVVPIPDDGIRHAGPVVMKLPADAEMDLESDHAMIGVEKNVLVVKWWQNDEADADGLENYILDFAKDFDIDMQLAADPIAVAKIPNASFARSKQWFDAENDWTIRMRVGCNAAWCVSILTFTSPKTVHLGDLQQVEASLGLLDP